jgi:hypothetical protein
MTAPWHMRRRERKFNPETVPLREWPFIYNQDDQRWYIDWSETVGFLIGCAIVACVIFIFGVLLYTGLVEVL